MPTVVVEDAVYIGKFAEILLVLAYELKGKDGDFELHVVVDRIDEVVMLGRPALLEGLT